MTQKHIPLNHYDVSQKAVGVFKMDGFSSRAPIDFFPRRISQSELHFQFWLRNGDSDPFVYVRNANMDSDYIIVGEVFNNGRVRLLSNDEERCRAFFSSFFDEDQFTASGDWIVEKATTELFTNNMRSTLGYAKCTEPLIMKSLTVDKGGHYPLQDYVEWKSELSVFRLNGRSLRNPIDYNFNLVDVSEVQRLRFWFPLLNDFAFVLLRMSNPDEDYVFHAQVYEDGSVEISSNDEGKADELFNRLYDQNQFEGVSQWVNDKAITAGFCASVLNSLTFIPID